MDLYGMILLRPKRCFLLSRLRLTSKTPRLTMNTVFIILAVTSDVVKKNWCANVLCRCAFPDTWVTWTPHVLCLCLWLAFWQSKTGWWFGTFYIFPYIGNNNPNGLIFFRGVGIPPTRKCQNRDFSQGRKYGDESKFKQKGPQIDLYMFSKVLYYQSNYWGTQCWPILICIWIWI